MASRIYVETLVRGDLERLWQLTHDPVQHARWDVRFSEITNLPMVEGEPQHFRYAVRVPGLRHRPLAGVGVSVGEVVGAGGARTSALRFRSEEPLSPIKQGSGYWRYVPVDGGVRFLTGYDYEPGWQGRVLDAAVVRPLIGYLTAWSFDRLRLWIELGIPPEVSRRRSLGVLGARAFVAGAAVAVMSTPWGIAGAVAALLVRVPIERPRARRCLRRAPDQRADSPPTTLANLVHP